MPNSSMSFIRTHCCRARLSDVVTLTFTWTVELCSQAAVEVIGTIRFPLSSLIHSYFSDAFACSHHRSPDYYAESIRSYKGFWGWACSSYINYLLGLCPRTNYLVIAGEDCAPNTRGMFLITTNGMAPFATGRWADAPLGVTKNGLGDLTGPVKHSGDPLLQHLDQWGKLEGAFNNVQNPNPMAFNDLLDAQWDDVMGSALGNSNNHLETKRPSVMVNRRKGTMGVRSKIASESPMDSNVEFLEQYKQNLTRGIMSSEAFRLPQVVFNEKKWSSL